MPRTRPDERLSEVARAATAAFGRLGYRGTRMADVAAQAGMSSGSLFNYVESKDALFHLVFAFGFGDGAEVLSLLPVATPPPGATLGLIEAGLRSVPAPKLRAAVRDDSPGDVRVELRGIVEERYDIIDRLWPLLAVIERCSVEMPDLEAFFFRRSRSAYFQQLTRYLQTRVDAGHLRPMPDTAVAARLVNESIVWFAWHRREGRDATVYDDDAARATVIEFVSSALLP